MNVTKKIDLKYSHHTIGCVVVARMKVIGNRMKVVAKSIVVIILQFINALNQHIIHLKLTQGYMTIKALN